MRPFSSRLLFLALFLFLHAGAKGAFVDHPGHWLGAMTVANGSIVHPGIEIYSRADGSRWASLSVPEQLAYDIPVSKIEEAGDATRIELPFGVMVLSWHEDHFDAQWTQGGKTYPLELSKVAGFKRTPRSQSPLAPFPYTEETLAIRSVGEVVLGATLTIPEGPPVNNLVILVAGSGPTNRDMEVAGHRTFAVLADSLARQGVAVIRYDKRGIGRSNGDYANHTEPQLVDDLLAVVATMKQRGQFNRIGLIGISEGSEIVATVAVRSPANVAFVVSLAGPGMPGMAVLELQDRVFAKDQGATQAETDRLMAYVDHFYKTVMANVDETERMSALKALQVSLSPDEQALVKKYRMNTGTLSIARAKQPALFVMLMSDIRKDWRAVRCPVLILNGGLDHQVPVENLSGIVAALNEGGNAKVESSVLPSINHLLQTATTGDEREYASIDETIAPAVLERIAEFIKRQQ
jgi:pimeloyl-ACP methyl ester carboxylesterase